MLINKKQSFYLSAFTKNKSIAFIFCNEVMEELINSHLNEIESYVADHEKN